jgi:hypothetical protein
MRVFWPGSGKFGRGSDGARETGSIEIDDLESEM